MGRKRTGAILGTIGGFLIFAFTLGVLSMVIAPKKFDGLADFGRITAFTAMPGALLMFFAWRSVHEEPSATARFKGGVSLLAFVCTTCVVLTGVWIAVIGPGMQYLIPRIVAVLPPGPRDFAEQFGLEAVNKIYSTAKTVVEETKRLKKDQGGDLYRRGKVLVLNDDEETIRNFRTPVSTVQLRLPESIRAKRPEEVSTVVFVKKSKEWVTTYTVPLGLGSPVRGYRCDYVLHVVGLEKKEYLGFYHMPGPPLPRQIKSGKSGISSGDAFAEFTDEQGVWCKYPSGVQQWVELLRHRNLE